MSSFLAALPFPTSVWLRETWLQNHCGHSRACHCLMPSAIAASLHTVSVGLLRNLSGRICQVDVRLAAGEGGRSSEADMRPGAMYGGPGATAVVILSTTEDVIGAEFLDRLKPQAIREERTPGGRPSVKSHRMLGWGRRARTRHAPQAEEGWPRLLPPLTVIRSSGFISLPTFTSRSAWLS